MKYTKEEIVARAKVCLKEKESKGFRYPELLVYMELITGKSKEYIENKIEQYAKGDV